jgi:5,10-methylenetetrahydromethanopterin reductase
VTLGFGLRLPPCVPVAEVADFARRAELAGIDMVWIPDSQFLWRDVWTTAALVADRTERIGIGIAVTNFETRHVAVTASAIAAVDELSRGRVRVAFGTGDSSVKTLGLAPSRLRRVREQLGLLRRLLRGEGVTWEGDSRYGGRPMRLRHAPRREVPVYLAASGPNALALAGEIADGVIVASGVAPQLVERALAHVRSGAERAGRALDDLDIWLGAHTLAAPDEATAVQLAKPLCLASAQLGATAALRSVGIDLDVPPVVAGVHPDITHAESWDLAVRAAESYIDDEAARRYAASFTLVGTDDQITERIQAATRPGVDAVYVLGLSSYELPHGQLDALARWIGTRRSRAMSNVQIVEKMYAAYGRGDLEALAACLDPEIEWAEPALDVLPYSGLTTGLDGVTANMFPQIREIYEKLEFRPAQMIDGGEVVAVTGHATAKGRDHPEETFPFAHVVRLRGGKVVRFDHFADTYKIARTLGAVDAGPRRRSRDDRQDRRGRGERVGDGPPCSR